MYDPHECACMRQVPLSVEKGEWGSRRKGGGKEGGEGEGKGKGRGRFEEYF